MSKSRPSLWQRFKQFLNADIPAKANVEESSKLNPDTAEKAHSAGTTNIATKTSGHINYAFEDDSRDKDIDHQSAITAEANYGNSLDEYNYNEPLNMPPVTALEVEQLLQQMGYQFVYHPAQEHDEQSIYHFTMQVSDKTHEWGCMIRYFSEQQLMAVYSILPFSVPESHRAQMLAVITYLNYDLMIGNLEMDVNDGELRFKTSLDLEVTGVSEMVLSYLLQSNFSLIARLYETLEEVVKKSEPINDLQQAVKVLTGSQQAKNYYLASDAIQ